jgi:hypothetical protein
VPEPRTTPQEHDKPAFEPRTPGSPTPDDPREHEPIHDPPVDPEHDESERRNPQQASGDDTRTGGGTGRAAADNVLFDESEKPG